MSKHTPEPWMVGGRFGTRVIDPVTKQVIAEIWNVNGLDQGKSDARRIVACVNACRGMETKWLEEFHEFASSGPPMVNLWNNAGIYRDQWAKSLRERDEARAMVTEFVAEVRKLIAPMNELLDHADGPEADRVFSQYEFDAVRTLLVKAEAHS